MCCGAGHTGTRVSLELCGDVLSEGAPMSAKSPVQAECAALTNRGRQSPLRAMLEMAQRSSLTKFVRNAS